MIFIYTDFGGTHTTSLAAAYHLNKLPTDRKLTKEEILNVEYFNKLKTEDMGKLFFMDKMNMGIQYIQLDAGHQRSLYLP